MSDNTRVYGLLMAIDKNDIYGTVKTDQNLNFRVKFEGSITCAYTGKVQKLKIGDKLSFASNKNGHLIIATDTHVFNSEHESAPAFDETKNISDAFYEIHQRETRFANKGLGIVVREDVTKYGSISLYDNYDDESDS